MDNYNKNYLSQRPQYLCRMCGLCCRVATSITPYSEIKKMAEEGEQGALDFLELFEPYPSIEDARKVSAATVDNIISRLKDDGNYVEEETTFYCCKYLNDDNTCSRYEERATLCKHFPASPWAIVPPGCGFEGWLFMKREEIKQKIRKTKEDLLELQLLKAKNMDTNTVQKILAVEKRMLESINTYRKYGSEHW
ncbi:YkgJ family cysteine cluster protein [bacterium]|nr:YkgJ family cysteine cluster protein [bacterium]